MERFVRIPGAIGSKLVSLAVTVLLQGVQLRAQPPVGAPTATPRAIATSTLTRVTVISKISDPSLIPNSANLLRVNPNGASPTVLGQLHDDGANGDLLAGDQLYAIQVDLNEPAAGQIQLQISAAFRGQLRRMTSDVITIPVTVAVNLPPDPGDAGKATIAGIDFDGDGVRDDVQRYIALAFPTSAKTRTSLTQITKAMQLFLMTSTDKQQSIANIIDVAHALECSRFIHGAATASTLMESLISQIVNTPARAEAYFVADSQLGGVGYKFTLLAQQKARCAVNPDTLPN